MSITDDTKVASLVTPREKFRFDGERVTPWVRAPVLSEHMHRYLSVLGICQGKRVLDIASGEGYGAALIAHNGAASVVGIDISSDMTDRANRIYGSDRLSFGQGDIRHRLDLPDDSFDVVTCFETIEHVSTHKESLAELHRVLRPGGILVISTPDKTHPASVNSTNPYHEKELDEKEFRNLVGRHFTHVHASYQRFFSGSVIVGENQRFEGRETFWQRENFCDYSCSDRPRHLRYIILWASETPLPAPPTGMLHDRALAEVLIRAGLEFGVD